MSELADALIARVQALESRLAHLEALEYVAQADLLDGLHAATSGANAHVVATDSTGATQLNGILTLLSMLVWSGTLSGIRVLFIPRKLVSDNVATTLFTITTMNESGDNDAGSYSCFAFANVAHGDSSTGAYVASKAFMAAFTRSMKKTGTGVNSAVTEICETASAATSSANRDVGTVTMSVSETSEYIQAVQFTADLTGSNVSNGYVTCWVVLIWSGFTTAPVIAAA